MSMSAFSYELFEEFFPAARNRYSGAKLIFLKQTSLDINKKVEGLTGGIIMPMIGTIGGPVVVDFVRTLQSKTFATD